MLSLHSTSSVDHLLKKCTGQRVTIPFLFALFPTWQAHFNPHDDPSIQDELHGFQKRWLTSPVALKRNRGVDPIFFSRSVFPDAELEDLKIAMVWFSWLYSWDDALDFGELDNRPEEMDRYQREMLSTIHHTLLEEPDKDADPTSLAPTCSAAQAWYKIGVSIHQRVNSVSSRKFMYDCLHNYTAATIELQKDCDKEKILDIESYLAIRMDTSAVYPTISLYLLTSHSDPPAWLFSHELVREALLHINIIISLCNDVVSARHEIESGHIDNIVPLLVYHKGLSPQQAIDEAVQMMKNSYLKFQSLEAQLMALGNEHKITQEVNDLVQAGVNLCMGAIQWTYHIKRYFDYDPKWGSVDMTVVLGTSNKKKASTPNGYLASFKVLLKKLRSALSLIFGF